MRNLFFGVALLSLTSSFVFAQQKPKSHEQCIKLVPGDWGPNFGGKWHENEARYWACRTGVGLHTIRAWQRAAEETETATGMMLATVDRAQLVLFVEGSGTANCYALSVLHQVGGTWAKAWELPSRKGDVEGYYCAGTCPALKAAMRGEILTVRSASSLDQNDSRCTRVHWESEKFRWNGTTFLPIK